MLSIINNIVLALNGGMSDEELAEIHARSIAQRTHVEELRSRIKSTRSD